MALRAKVELVNLQGAIKFESLEAALDYVHANASVHASSANATDIETVFITDNRFLEEVFGAADIDVIYFRKNIANETEIVSDTQRKDFGKNLAEQSLVTDTFIRAVQFSRVFDEPVGVASQATKAVQKSLSESETVTEAISKGIGKAPIDELAAIGDFTRTVVFKRVPNEALGLTDVFAKQVAYSRVFNDVVFPTDDLDGEASLQDDQEIAFVKTRTDLTHTADVFSRTVSFNREFTDAAGAGEQATKGFGKALEDASAFADVQNFSLGKALSDTPIFVDTQALDVSKPLIESGVATDSSEKGVSKPTTDSFGAIDLSTVDFEKAQTDPVSTADAGSLVSQGYVDNNQYFAEVYVGTSRSF
jgi:hypothetical protein